MEQYGGTVVQADGVWSSMRGTVSTSGMEGLTRIFGGVNSLKGAPCYHSYHSHRGRSWKGRTVVWHCDNQSVLQKIWGGGGEGIAGTRHGEGPHAAMFVLPRDKV